MKLLVIGIDALEPGFLKENIEQLPNIKKLSSEGILGDYDGYVYGYGSCDNWISLYTGVKPEEHGTIKNIFIKTGESTQVNDYEHLNPFWTVLNDNGYRVGMWKAMRTSPPQNIDGYMASGELALEDGLRDSNVWSNEPVFVKEKSYLSDLVKEPAPKMSMPPGPEEYGYSWTEVNNSPEVLKNIMTSEYFKGAVEEYRSNLKYQLDCIKKVNDLEKVDLFWFYDPIYDFISHFVYHDAKRVVLKETLKVVDWFVGELLNIIDPENVILLSDHGQLAYGEHFPNTTLEVKKEAFGLADQSIFTDDKIYIPARNGGFLTAAHSLKATFIASGPIFNKNKQLGKMRNLDIYPLLLEIFECKIKNQREGLIPDILNKKKYINEDFKAPFIQDYKSVLIISNMPVYDMNAFINQFYLGNRFMDIYIYSEEKYRTTYEVNPQIKEVITSQSSVKVYSLLDKIVIPTSKKGVKLDYLEFKVNEKEFNIPEFDSKICFSG
jgi:predicted AlkP superfamily phosphohydrolase/phosphomutase